MTRFPRSHAKKYHNGGLLHVNEALDRLALHDATKAEIAKLRFFSGMETREIALVLGLTFCARASARQL